MQSSPDILIDADGLVGAPDEAAAEEGGEQDNAIVPLVFRAGKMQFIKEPVDVEKWGGELVEDKSWTVEIQKGSLFPHQTPTDQHRIHWIERRRRGNVI